MAADAQVCEFHTNKPPHRWSDRTNEKPSVDLCNIVSGTLNFRLEDTLRQHASVSKELTALTDMHSTLSNYTENLKQQHRE